MIEVESITNQIINSDCMDILKQLPDKCIDLVVTDAPYYAIVKEDWDNQWKDIFDFQNWVGEIGKELCRVLKDNGSFYWFGDDKTIAYCQVALDKYFSLLNNIVWRKQYLQTMKGAETVFRSYAPITERCLFYAQEYDINTLDLIMWDFKKFDRIRNYLIEEKEKLKNHKNFTNQEFNNYTIKLGCSTTCYKNNFCKKGYFEFPTQKNYELLQKSGFFKKTYEELRREYEGLRREYEGLRRVWNNDMKALDVLDYKICNDKDRFHPTQKPLNLISYLIQRSSNENDLILDCFSGSGTTAVACHNLRRRFICIEKDYDYWKASVERLKNAQAQLKLF